jgi:hypothetical protein
MQVSSQHVVIYSNLVSFVFVFVFVYFPDLQYFSFVSAFV